MFLVELVMQGIRGFRDLARLRFQSGFNFVAAGNEAGKTTAVETAQRLLFPSSQSGAMDSLLSRQKPDASRGALVLFSGDGAYYRIIQDFSKRAVNLSKYDPEKKEFALLHKDWSDAEAFMATLTTGMSEEDFSKIFILRRDHYADRPAKPASAPARMPHPQPIKPVISPGRQTTADQAKLAELREALKKAEEAADAEYRAQSAKIALDEIRKKLTSIEDMEQKKKELDSKLEELKACATLPQNLHEIVETHERLQGQRLVETEDLNKQMEGLRSQLEGIPAVNLLTDKLFIGGVVLGVISIVAGVFWLTEEYKHFFPVGLLLAAGLIAVAWYNGSRKNARRSTVANELEVLEKERNDLEKRREQENAPIYASMKAVGAATPGELKEKSDNYRYFSSLRADIDEQHRRFLNDADLESLQQEYNKRQQEALDLEKAARAVAQYNVDTYAIRQDIERIEATSLPSGTSRDFAAEIQDFTADFLAPPAEGKQDGFTVELGVASRIGGIEIETLIPAVEAAAQRNLITISNGRYVRVDMGQNGGPPLVHARDDSVVRHEDQSHGTRDLVYFCLRIGLIEALVGKLRMPVLLDDPLAGFDFVRQKASYQVLRALGSKTQVILFSSNTALKTEGDAFLELK